MNINILHRSLDLIRICSRWLKKHKWIQFAFNLTLFIILISFIANYLIQDWQEVRKLSISFNYYSTLQAFGLYGINFYLLNFGWHLLVRSFIKSSNFKQNAIFYSVRFVGCNWLSPLRKTEIVTLVSLFSRMYLHIRF